MQLVFFKLSAYSRWKGALQPAAAAARHQVLFREREMFVMSWAILSKRDK
jgi:hypothetical protein